MISAVIAGVAVGYLCSLVTRSRDIWGDVFTGFGGGLVFGLSMFAMGVGQAVVLATGVVPSLTDLQLLSGVTTTTERDTREAVDDPGAADDPENDPLVARYSDLASIAANERRDHLFRKIVADQVAGAFAAIWLGMALCMGGGVLLTVVQCVIAGRLLRRYARIWSGAWRYLLQFIFVAALPIMIWRPMGSYGWGWSGPDWTRVAQSWPHSALAVVLVILALVALVREWRPLVTFALFTCALIASSNAASPRPIGEGDSAAYLGNGLEILAYASTAVLLAYYYGRRQKEQAAEAT
jgi:hypothetical protein